MFRKVAGPKIAAFMWKYMVSPLPHANTQSTHCNSSLYLPTHMQCYHFLLAIMRNTPSDSPLDNRWPSVRVCNTPVAVHA